MAFNPELFESLQSEFCPPLDTSLVAAILLDIDLDPSEEQIISIRTTLKELATQADELQLSEEFSDLAVPSLTDDTFSTPSFCRGETSPSSSSASSGFESPPHAFSSPLGFLHAALPHIPSPRLYKALLDAGVEEGELDMWEIVAGILTEESIREMEERGLDEQDGGLHIALPDEEQPWEVVDNKKKARTHDIGRKKRNRDNKNKITLVDIRQQQHIKPAASRSATLGISGAAAPDPWTQISSLSSHLAALLPPHTDAFFQSYFHSPKYSTPYNALHAALTFVSEAQDASQDHSLVLIGLLDILLPSYLDLDSEQQSRLISDTELSLSATQGRGDDALEVVKLLRDLEADASCGQLEMGVYHQPTPKAQTFLQSLTTTSNSSSNATNLPSGPPPVPPPPTKGNRSNPPTPTRKKPSPYQWQSVPQRKIPRITPHPLAAHIPAYSVDVNGKKVRGSGNGMGKGGKGDVGELRRRIGANMRKRDEMLREASKMWQRGNAKTRGGEVAMYFAERARAFEEVARKDSLEVARMTVEAKRLASRDRDTIDLHGTTAAEAVHIAKETLHATACTPARPLKIITGRGAHSANQVSVLKPAIKKALVEDGWSVSLWDGGLIVRGKRGAVG